jgi:hypothetical protein
MNSGELHKQLIAAARTIPLDERVPYAFEKRVMARLAPSARLVDAWAVWSHALWKGALTSIAIMACCGVWAAWAHHRSVNGDFSQQFESAVFASASTDEAW